MLDVIVVGAGPGGSQVACKLAGLGYETVVLEQKERLGERVCCTGIIGQECVSSFAVDDNVILRWVNSAKLFSPSGKLVFCMSKFVCTPEKVFFASLRRWCISRTCFCIKKISVRFRR